MALKIVASGKSPPTPLEYAKNRTLDSG
jgi:hypothetical protein